MIDSKFHVEIDGEPYRLSKSSDDRSYSMRGEPLRPPNAVTVQGENTQKFQPRSEVLLWNWTDWSEGEGRRTLRFGESGRSWQLNAVRVFEEPGHLIPGYYVERTQDSTGAADFNQQAHLVVGAGRLWALGRGSGQADQSYWDGSKWTAWTALGGVTNGCNMRPVGDASYVYFHEYDTQKVWRMNSSGVAGTISNSTITSSTVSAMAQNDDYVYVFLPWSAEVWEVSKAGTATTLIDTWENVSASALSALHPHITEMDGRIYVAVVQDDYTSLREITPSSAAGTGFGSEIARVQGFQAEGFWAHQGKLYMTGIYRDPAEERAVLYFQPGGSYGTLGEVRPGDDVQNTNGGGVRMLDHFFATEHLTDTLNEFALFQVDSVSGGFACVAYDEGGTLTNTTPESIVAWDGSIFVTTQPGAGNDFIARVDSSRYPDNSSAISPEHDFDLVGKKFLSSMVLGCEPLPADWTVYVDYQINGSGTWTNVITYTTDGGNGTEQAVTTDTSTVEFRRLQMRVRFEYTGAGIPTSAPVVLGVEARAIVAEKVRVWSLVLDLSDDRSAGKQSKSGASKTDTFQATALKATSIDFKDGYTSAKSGEYDTYDVFVDDYDIALDRPGEGVAIVTLREVI